MCFFRCSFFPWPLALADIGPVLVADVLLDVLVPGIVGDAVRASRRGVVGADVLVLVVVSTCTNRLVHGRVTTIGWVTASGVGTGLVEVMG